jgi:hypothetical protein
VNIHKDPRSLALHREVTEQVRAAAKRETARRLKMLGAKEKRKFGAFIRNLRFYGDVSIAMKKARIARARLEKWMETPGFSWTINSSFNDAQLKLHSAESAEDVLWRIKVFPQLEHDAMMFQATGQRNRESRIVAKLTAADLKLYRWHLAQAATNNDKHFFIDLGKCLSGNIAIELYSDRDLDYAIADICCREKTITAKRAVAELAKRGHNDISEEHFRVIRARLGLAKPQTAKRNKFP